MGAALAYWRPILYVNDHPEKELLCSQAKSHYGGVEPWPGSDPYVFNMKIVYALEIHCSNSDWEEVEVHIDAANAEASAIAYFILAKRCTTENVKEGCDYLAELTSAEKHVLFARALLVRQYILRETGNNCPSAEPFLESFRNEVLNPQDIRELRALLRIKAMNC